MEEKIEQSGKKNGRPYQVELLGTVKCTVWAEDEADAKKEVQETAEAEGFLLQKYEIVSVGATDGEEA
ncbi:MAG: hypothetical protein IKI35_05760 [Stomatobaculum sp.]|nr:hypothetical protein [Stomatobaculum sp.]MBR7058215.1 hypothetical protein [Stomatobaculum sp.]